MQVTNSLIIRKKGNVYLRDILKLINIFKGLAQVTLLYSSGMIFGKTASLFTNIQSDIQIVGACLFID